MKKTNLYLLVPNAVALAMGVVSIILLILNQSQETVLMLGAIGVACLGFAGLQTSAKG